MQADSLPAEPPGKPKNTGVGSLSLLQGIFPTQKLNQGFLHCRQILYQLSYQGSHGRKESLLYFRCWQLGGHGGGQTSVQRQIPPTDDLVGQEFLMAGEGLHAETAQSALTVILKLVIGGLSGVILLVLVTVSLQFQGKLVSIL